LMLTRRKRFLRLEAEDSIATTANLNEDAYVHCPQLGGNLKKNL